MTTPAMAKAAASDPTGVAAVVAAFGDHGIPPDEADRVVNFESGWNPAAFNSSSSSVGLLQWTPSTLKSMPGSPSTSMVKAMSRTGQAALVAAFFDPSRGYVRTRDGDSYLWMAATSPKWLTSPPETVVYPSGSRAWQLNKLLRDPTVAGNPITVRRLLALGSGAESPGGIGTGTPGKLPGTLLGSSSGGGLLLLLLLVALRR